MISVTEVTRNICSVFNAPKNAVRIHRADITYNRADSSLFYGLMASTQLLLLGIMLTQHPLSFYFMSSPNCALSDIHVYFLFLHFRFPDCTISNGKCSIAMKIKTGSLVLLNYTLRESMHFIRNTRYHLWLQTS